MTSAGASNISAKRRSRCIRLAAYSLDVEIFAYVGAADWNQFLEVQEGLLLGVMETVNAAGAEIAFPSQMNYAASEAAPQPERL